MEIATSETPEKIRKRMTFRRIILIAAIIVVAIVCIVYASALLDAHFSINGTEHESVDYIETWSNIS